jgi:hypothetical protein
VCGVEERGDRPADVGGAAVPRDEVRLRGDVEGGVPRDGWHHREPPFEAALVVDDGVERVVKVSEVEFDLEPVPPAPT